MAIYRVCKSFTVESGHMLSKHPERCRFPHGHTRRIEVVVSAKSLDAHDMVIDFKALKLAVRDYVNGFDHAMAINSADPLLPSLRAVYPDSVVEFKDQDPTTEAMAKRIYDYTASVLHAGFALTSDSGASYVIPADRCRLERVRVWETPSSWAEYGEF